MHGAEALGEPAASVQPSDAAPRPGRSWRRRILRDPLLHFLVIGFALFAIYGVLHDKSQSTDPRRIQVTADDARRIEISWLARWQRPPTGDEMRGLIDDQIREEILYREALALGLDKNDEIVRRRLAQKMDFLVDDVATLREPAAGEVEAWFAGHPQQFAPPPMATFHHLFFASDSRGARAQADAVTALAGLARPDALGGDPFMYQSSYAEQISEQVARVFGARFTTALFQLEPGGWRGPIESGYGWHLVWVDALTPSDAPEFAAVAEQVKAAWLAEQRATTKRAAFEAMRARYEVVVEASPASGSVVSRAGQP